MESMPRPHQPELMLSVALSLAASIKAGRDKTGPAAAA
jgi:hypothetical protein